LLSDPLHLVILIAICASLGALSYIKKMFDFPGAIFAFFYGFVVGFFGGFEWLFIMLFFLFLSYGITKLEFETKKRRNVQEGKKGERGILNIVSNGLIPMIIAMFHPFMERDAATFLFTVALATATADTFASEIGTLSDRVYLITNFKKVPPGTNGGVSPLGTFASLIGAINISAVSLAVMWGNYPINYFIISVFLGFIGCQIDSILGATLENRGYIGKGTVNFLAIGISTLLALLFI